jgi:hypothetical protein
MPSPPSGQAALDLNAGRPEQGPPAGASPLPPTRITRLDVDLDVARARDLAITLGFIGYSDVGAALRAALDELEATPRPL